MRDKLGRILKGSIPWNKGIKGICKPNSTSFKKGHIPWIKGKRFTYEELHGTERAKEMKKAISDSLKGNQHTKGKKIISSGCFKKGIPSWNKGKRFTYEELHGTERAKELKKAISDFMKANKHLGSFKKGMIPWNKGKKTKEETIKKWINSINFRPTSYEIKLKEILDTLQPNEWKYTGDGTFWMGYPPLNPDFVNCNGKKIAIEVFANFHKERNFGSVENYISQRRKEFNKYGWKTIFIYGDTELKNPELILNKIKQIEV
ncbi:MAG: hypothetical protein IH934_04635 [Nanoarchaeota archaeon]|nr:hypothetical protein [Nanoarchaeota archaeon]